jgi:hypothetical protein
MVRQMTPEMQPAAPERIFNSPLECGLRTLFVLHATSPTASDLQRLISYDYLLVHSGDVDRETSSLHPAVPFRSSELLVKRDLVRHALDLMFARELVEKRLSKAGITYAASALTSPFIALLKSDYSRELGRRAEWVAIRFGSMSDHDLNAFMAENIGKWGAEFEKMTALRDLDLEID